MSATFVAPTSLDDVLAALASGAVALAGGTDLVVGHRQGKKPLPDALVAIDRVPTLRGISGDAAITIGAFTTHDDDCRSTIASAPSSPRSPMLHRSSDPKPPARPGRSAAI